MFPTPIIPLFPQDLHADRRFRGLGENLLLRLLLTVAALGLFGGCNQAQAAPPQQASHVTGQPAFLPGDPSSTSLTQTDFTDGWWVPSESGWGMNVLQQGSTLVLMFYVFDEQNAPVWYLGTATLDTTTGVFGGPLTYHRGTHYMGVVFGPVLFSPQTVGEISFQPTSAYTATVSYTIGTTTINKSMQRLSFMPMDFAGTYVTAVIGTLSQCEAPYSSFERTQTATATLTGGQMQLVLADATGYCAFSGALVQRGQLGEMREGVFACTSGQTGVVTFDEWSINRNGMTARYSKRSGDCLEQGLIAGARRL
jgi:hypothetical protein